MNGKSQRNVVRPRSRAGSVIAEFAPALFLLLFFFFFPLVDLTVLAISYCSCMCLNDLQVREAALEPSDLATSADGAVKRDIPSTFANSGIGKFSNVDPLILTSVSYPKRSAGTSSSQDVYVAVKTTTTVRPFLTVPFFPGVPGLSAPVTFEISSERVVENAAGVSTR